MLLACVVGAVLLWLALAVSPWRPVYTDAEWPTGADDAFDRDVTILMPARNEATVIGRSLAAVRAQGRVGAVIVVDDASTDGTSAAAHAAGVEDMTIMAATPLPSGWTGKLWALEQGRVHVRTPYVLLLDADIALDPGVVAALVAKARTGRYALVSLMAAPAMRGFWDRWLMPAFIYFFQLLYPFRLANNPRSAVAAAAGGCVLLKTSALAVIGGFGALRGAVIDDCTLARLVKRQRLPIWIGASRRLVMLRANTLVSLWRMVARTAFAQLRYSVLLLAACTVIMLLMFGVPLVGLVMGGMVTHLVAVLAIILMAVNYAPTLRFYGQPVWVAVTLPIIGLLFLAMTYTSALWYARGVRSYWKGRAYARVPD